MKNGQLSELGGDISFVSVISFGYGKLFRFFQDVIWSIN